MKLFKTVLLVAATAMALPAMAQDKSAAKAAPADKSAAKAAPADKGAAKGASNMEILRDKIRADKKLLVAQNMTLTDAEGKGFWPLYDTYQKDLAALNDRIVKAVSSYADAYNKGAVPNDVAMKLLNDALAIEEDETKLKRSYIPKLEKVVAGAKVARYIQIENKIRTLVRLELAANIPLAD